MYSVPNALLHFAHPVTFTAVLSQKDKSRIRTAFAQKFGISPRGKKDAMSVDLDLHSINAGLLADGIGHAGIVDYYEQDLHSQWNALPGSATPLAPAPKHPTGTAAYKPQNKGQVEKKETVWHEVDPTKIAAAVKAHMDLQDLIAKRANHHGLRPLRPTDSAAEFDVAWQEPETATIVEVKSLSATNEDKQLRLGLGQLLSYEHRLNWSCPATRLVLAVPHRPIKDDWVEICRKHGVVLLWASTVDTLFEESP